MTLFAESSARVRPARVPGNRRRFLAWVQSYGDARLAKDLGVQRRTVRQWTCSDNPARIMPRPLLMDRIVTLSSREPYIYGPLTFEDMLLQEPVAP